MTQVQVPPRVGRGTSDSVSEGCHVSLGLRSRVGSGVEVVTPSPEVPGDSRPPQVEWGTFCQTEDTGGIRPWDHEPVFTSFGAVGVPGQEEVGEVLSSDCQFRRACQEGRSTRLLPALDLCPGVSFVYRG